VYSRKVDGNEYTFGVSGLLYKSNVLMYDHQTESLWSQVLRQAVTGSKTGTLLEVLPSTVTTWGKWKKKYPNTEVLSLETGHKRDYTIDPYENYYKQKKGFFSFFKPGPGEEEKQLVVGVVINGVAKGYPIKVLREKKVIKDKLAFVKITLEFDPETDLVTVKDDEGNDLPYTSLYWFVWKGIYEKSGLYGR
jgi:hypothetical protein